MGDPQNWALRNLNYPGAAVTHKLFSSVFTALSSSQSRGSPCDLSSMRDLRRVVAQFVQQFSSWDDGSDNLGGWELKVGNQVPIFFLAFL